MCDDYGYWYWCNSSCLLRIATTRHKAKSESRAMEMFRKPKQRNLRGRTDLDASEDDQITVTVPIPTKIEPTKPKTLLSFGDDEGDTEEFKVNKTRESRKMAKEVKKQLKQTTNEPKIIKAPPVEEVASDKEENKTTNNGEIEIKFKPLQIVGNKNSTNSFSSTQTDIQRLRKEMRVLNSQESVPDDFESFEGNDDDEDVNQLDETQRSVKLMLRSGVIPDSTMIHAARKRRQMAREMGGAPADFLALKTENDKDKNSRLIRDDENDASDESGTEDPNIVSMDRNKSRAESERQKNRDRFLELEQGSDNDEDDEEFRRFEHEQIRKGVSSKVSSLSTMKKLTSSIVQNSHVESEPMELEIIRDVPPVDLPPVTFAEIRQRLENSYKTIDETHKKREKDFETIREAFRSSENSLEQNTIDYPRMEKSYQFYQRCRDFLHTFLSCYNEKMLIITNLEDRWMQLHKQRTENFVNRRQEDIKDQGAEYPISKAMALVAGTLTTNDFRIPLDQKRQRRATEREARRLRRRKNREDSSIEHHDGMSTDDEENQSEINAFLNGKQEILNEVEHINDDVSDEFSRCKNVKKIFEQWKFNENETYSEAFIEICLPKYFSPIIRKEMIDWNPIETPCRALKDYQWYDDLLFYGVRDENDEFQMIPLIIEKVVVPKLTNIVENLYDPLSSKQTTNLVRTIEDIFQIYPTMNDDSKNVQNFLQKLVDRLQRSIDDDIYIPLYPKEIISIGSSTNSSSNSSSIVATEFFFRQFWTCVKLVKNITQWSKILSLKTIVDLSIDGLLNRYILSALRQMDLTSTEMIHRCFYLAKCFPVKQWINDEQRTTLPALEQFCSFLQQLAGEYSDKYFIANDKEKKIFKENLRQIRTIFVHLNATDHAIDLTNQYEIK